MSESHCEACGLAPYLRTSLSCIGKRILLIILGFILDAKKYLRESPPYIVTIRKQNINLLEKMIKTSQFILGWQPG